MTYQYKYLKLVFDESGKPFADLDRKVPMGESGTYKSLGSVHYPAGLCRWFLDNVYCRPMPGSPDAITAGELKKAIKALDEWEMAGQS